jgi:glutamyl-tRNA synthetase
MPVAEFVAACDPWIPEHYDREVFAAMAPLLQTRVVTLAEAPPMVDFLFVDEPVIDEASWAKAMKPAWAGLVLDESVAVFADLPWTAEALKTALEQVAAGHDLKLGKAQAPVRVAVTGRAVGPPLFESLGVLGREESLRRLRAGRQRVGV